MKRDAKLYQWRSTQWHSFPTFLLLRHTSTVSIFSRNKYRKVLATQIKKSPKSSGNVKIGTGVQS